MGMRSHFLFRSFCTWGDNILDPIEPFLHARLQTSRADRVQQDLVGFCQRICFQPLMPFIRACAVSQQKAWLGRTGQAME